MEKDSSPYITLGQHTTTDGGGKGGSGSGSGTGDSGDRGSGGSGDSGDRASRGASRKSRKSRISSVNRGSATVSESRSSDKLKSRTGTSGDESDDVDYQRSAEFTIALLEREENLRYGWGKFTPAWLQWCCTPRFLLASLLLIAFSQGFFVNGILVSSWPALHGRFHLNMIELAAIRCMYDVGLIFGFFPVVYFTARGDSKRSTLIGLSCLVMAFGALLCALPHFCIDKYDLRGWAHDNERDICPRADRVQKSSSVSFGVTTSMKKTTILTTESFLNDSILTTESFLNDSTLTTEFFLNDSILTTESFLNDSKLIAESILNDSTTPKATDSYGTSKRHCQEATALKDWKYAFIIGVFLNGFGAAAYFTMGIAFLDESVTHQTSVIYTGILNAVLLVGALSGLIFNYQVLRYYYIDLNWGVEPPRGLDADHYRWRGAWWIGMLVSGALFVVSALPMFGFPKQMPGAMKAHVEDAAEMDSDRAEEAKDRRPYVVHTMWKSMKVCLTNVTWLGLTLEQITCWATITSISAFLAEYIYAVYGVPRGIGRLINGIVIIFALIGSGMGTFIQYKFKFGVMANLSLALATAVASAVFLGGIFLGCTEGQFAGYTISYPVKNSYFEEPNASATCNEYCYDKCGNDEYDAFCFLGRHPSKPRGKMIRIAYFSPCVAGCASSNSSGGYDCSCVPKDDKNFEGGGNIEQAGCGTNDCLFRSGAAAVLFCWCSFLLFVRMNPLQHTFLRCIPFKDRAVGLSMTAILARIFGAIPAPLTIGAILYYACDVREYLCKEEAECRLRNEESVAMWTGIAAYAVCCLGIIGLLIAMWDQYFKKSGINSSTPSGTPRSGTPRSKGKYEILKTKSGRSNRGSDSSGLVVE